MKPQPCKWKYSVSIFQACRFGLPFVSLVFPFSDADMQSIAVKVAAKERRARELEEEVETKARQVAVLQSKEVSVRRKGLLKV